MSNDITSVDKKMLAILKAIQKGGNIPKPFGKEILLLKTYIAGTNYSDAKKVSDKIKKGNYLIFQREADNEYDRLAIKIMDLDNNKLGYIPKAKNEIISKLMDAGKVIYGVIDYKEWKGDYLNLDISVYLKEL